jgi:hypothetical protein
MACFSYPRRRRVSTSIARKHCTKNTAENPLRLIFTRRLSVVSCTPISASAAGLAGPDQLGRGIRAQDADRGVKVHQVGAELAKAGVKRLGLAGKGGTLAD